MGALPGLCPRKREAEALHSTGVSALLSPRAAREAPESAESRSGHGAPGEPGFPGAGLREREGRRGVWACGGAPQGGWVQGAGSAPGVEGAGDEERARGGGCRGRRRAREGQGTESARGPPGVGGGGAPGVVFAHHPRRRQPGRRRPRLPGAAGPKCGGCRRLTSPRLLARIPLREPPPPQRPPWPPRFCPHPRVLPSVPHLLASSPCCCLQGSLSPHLSSTHAPALGRSLPFLALPGHSRRFQFPGAAGGPWVSGAPRGPLRPASGVGGDRAIAPQHPYSPGSGVQPLSVRGSRAPQRPAFAGSWKTEDAPGRAGWRRGRCCSKQREREGLPPISSHGFLWSLLGSPWSDMKGRGKGVRESCGRDRNGELSPQ